jgi:hypothetical protein
MNNFKFTITGSYFGLTSGYVGWFHSYLTSNLPWFKISGIILLPFRILSGFSEFSVLGLLLLNIFSDDICSIKAPSKFLLSADYIKAFEDVKSFSDCTWS